jgi:hypothetical protein
MGRRVSRARKHTRNGPNPDRERTRNRTGSQVCTGLNDGLMIALSSRIAREVVQA